MSIHYAKTETAIRVYVNAYLRSKASPIRIRTGDNLSFNDLRMSYKDRMDLIDAVCHYFNVVPMSGYKNGPEELITYIFLSHI